MGAILSAFSFHGRARRTSYGLFFLITVGVYFGLSMVLYVAMIRADFGNIVEKMRQQDPKTAEMLKVMQAIPMEAVWVAVGVSAVVVVLLYAAWIAISVRRLHDMNATGWLVILFVVIALVPYLGYILDSLVLVFWPGKRGPNTYGPDPRAPVVVADIFDRPASPQPLR